MLHSRSARAARIASAIHCVGKLIGSPYRRDKKRNDNRHKSLDPLHKAAVVKVGTPRLLSVCNSVNLVNEGRNKTQSQRHHHCKRRHGHLNELKRSKKLFKGIRQNGRSSSIGQKRTDNNKTNYSYRHKQGGKESVSRDMNKMPVHKLCAASDIENVQHGSEQNYNDDRL